MGGGWYLCLCGGCGGGGCTFCGVSPVVNADTVHYCGSEGVVREYLLRVNKRINRE